MIKKRVGTKKTVGKRLKEFRIGKGMTQIELSSLLGLKSTSHVSLIESGARALSSERLYLAAEIFNVHPTVFFSSSQLSLKDQKTIDLYAKIVLSDKAKPAAFKAVKDLIIVMAKEMDIF